MQRHEQVRRLEKYKRCIRRYIIAVIRMANSSQLGSAQLRTKTLPLSDQEAEVTILGVWKREKKQ